MKTFKNIARIALLTGVATAMGQTTPPKPPTPPSTTTSITTSDSGNVVIITQSGDSRDGGNTSFSVSSSDGEYLLKSRHPDSRYPAIKEFLLQELGAENLQADETSMAWSLEGDEDAVYKIQLSEGRLKMKLDKTIASSDLIEKFEDMGSILKTLISDDDEHRNAERLERDADRARRDAQRMQREADRLRQMSESDADRLTREATALKQKTDRLSLASKRGVGIDGYLREVLRHPSTKYQPSTTENSDWKWPAMQDALLIELVKNGLISEGEEVALVKEKNGMYLNGDRMAPAVWTKYNGLFRKYKYGRIGDVSFYKQGDHIVVLSGPKDLEDLLEELEDEGLIKDIKTETIIEINGASVVVDGTKLSPSETKRWNKVLHKERVIPAPGITIKIGKKSASLGYSFDNNTIGTFIAKD